MSFSISPLLRTDLDGVFRPRSVAIYGISERTSQRIAEINGEPGIVSYVNGRPQSVFTIEVNDGRIHAIFIVTNPEKLSRLPPPPS